MNPALSNQERKSGMKKLALILATASLLFPLFAGAQTTDANPAPSGAAYQFQRQGIFDCNQNGSYAMSVGALSAMGGAYVPVADAAVELNTGTLVYKECVLREVVDREREAALSAFLKQMYANIQSGRNGNPMYVQNEGKELLTQVSDPAFLNLLQDGTLNTLNPSLQPAVKRALAQQYESQTRSPQNALTCPYQGDLAAFQQTGALPSGTFFTDFWAASQPQCDPLIAASMAWEIAEGRVSDQIQYQQNQWNQGGGFYARTDANGNVITPSSVVEQSFEQMIQSPVQQLQSANDIGQMIGALYAGVTTQVVGDNQGLAGLAQSVGGQPSYLDQVAAESSQGLQGAANNAALQILNASQQVESAYYQAANAIGASLTQTTQQLQAAEAQCWAALIPKVCATPLAKDNTCTAFAGPCTTDANGNQTCPVGPVLKVATSTAFSDAVIASQITPFVAAAATNIQTSQSALQLISNLIQGITNTASLDAQRVALQQLDTLVSQHQLHTQTDLTTIVQQQAAVATNMGNLLQRIAQIWSGTGTDGTGNIQWDGTTNPGNGWCNLNNSATIAAWIQVWTKK
jgi:hypothetical protein